MQHINSITSFEQMHFDQSSVTVSPPIPNIHQLLGIHLTSSQIIAISGAPSGSSISISHLNQTTTFGSEQVPAGVYFTVTNATYLRISNVIGIFRDEASTFGIYIKSIDLITGTPKGLAARMLAVIIRQVLALGGFTRLTLLAAGGRGWSDLNPTTGERWGGYVAWPTFRVRHGFAPRNYSYSEGVSSLSEELGFSTKSQRGANSSWWSRVLEIRRRRILYGLRCFVVFHAIH
jgi:hypothetical protein